MKQDQNMEQSILSFENAVSVEKLEERLEMTALAAEGDGCCSSYTCIEIEV